MHLRTLIAFLCLLSAFAVAKSAFIPGNFTASDGALTLAAGGNFVEPYFATKALLVAQDAGLDVRDTSLRWIVWILPRQRSDGRFDRFCKKPDGQWKPCGEADADDSMMALWMELLYRNTPETGLPPEWQQSAERSRVYLESLRNRWGVYHVSRSNHVALFMDNVEVFAAFKDTGAHLSLSDGEGGAAMQQQAQQLAKSIQRVFWDEKAQRYRMSTQNRKPAFYPDAVGQTYPWLEQMPTPQDSGQAWSAWKQRFGGDWLHERYDAHAWGLIALTALRFNDTATAQCWLNKSEPRRRDAQWNILEEAAFQAVQAKVTAPAVPGSCSELVAGQ